MGRRVSVLVVGAALALGGCGDSDPGKPATPEDQVRATIQSAYTAFAKADADGFCGRLSSDYLPDFEEYYEGKCEAATIQAILGQLDSTQKESLEKPEIGAVKIESDGKSAYPDVNGEGLEVVKEGGEWKLDDFDLPGGE
jgi:hypothetical protein